MLDVVHVGPAFSCLVTVAALLRRSMGSPIGAPTRSFVPKATVRWLTTLFLRASGSLTRAGQPDLAEGITNRWASRSWYAPRNRFCWIAGPRDPVCARNRQGTAGALLTRSSFRGSWVSTMRSSIEARSACSVSGLARGRTARSRALAGCRCLTGRTSCSRDTCPMSGARSRPATCCSPTSPVARCTRERSAVGCDT
jgi:hypothetical protein